MILNGYQVMVKTFAARRPVLNNLWKEAFPANGPVPKSLIEISGEAGSGKSIVLYEIVARASLTDFYGGKYSEVIFLDLTHKFDWDIFDKFIEKLVTENATVCSQRTLENLLKYCASVIYVPCYSPDQFELAFEELEDLLWDHRKVSLIAIDGLDTFYWDECHYHLQRMATHYKKLIKRLKPLCEENNICCAYTVDASYTALKSRPNSYFPHSLIDYKLELKNKNGRYYLNNSRIKINYDGISFL